ILMVAVLGTSAAWLACQAAGSLLPEADGTPPAAPPRDGPAEPHGPLLREFNHQGFVRVVTFAPGGKVLLSGGDNDRTVRLWDLETGKELVQMKPDKELTGIALSPDGTTVATGEIEGTVRLWQAATGKPLATLKGHTATVISVAFAPDGKTLASAGF